MSRFFFALEASLLIEIEYIFLYSFLFVVLHCSYNTSRISRYVNGKSQIESVHVSLFKRRQINLVHSPKITCLKTQLIDVYPEQRTDGIGIYIKSIDKQIIILISCTQSHLNKRYGDIKSITRSKSYKSPFNIRSDGKSPTVPLGLFKSIVQSKA